MFAQKLSLGVLALLLLTAASPSPPRAPVELAQAGACTSGCQASYNQCRIATKGSPSCDAQLQACLRSCIASKR